MEISSREGHGLGMKAYAALMLNTPTLEPQKRETADTEVRYTYSPVFFRQLSTVQKKKKMLSQQCGKANSTSCTSAREEVSVHKRSYWRVMKGQRIYSPTALRYLFSAF